jgi:hypothetical protein
VERSLNGFQGDSNQGWVTGTVLGVERERDRLWRGREGEGERRVVRERGP